jgi:hypothetical protein
LVTPSPLTSLLLPEVGVVVLGVVVVAVLVVIGQAQEQVVAEHRLNLF